jgi:glycosyltransferase involved in cell wall biosynthesis
MDRLVDRGVPRGLLRVLPEAVDRHRFTDLTSPERDAPGHRVGLVGGGEGSAGGRLLALLRRLPGCEPVVLPGTAEVRDVDDRPALLRSVDAVVATDDTDDEVALVLQAMSCGIPVVAADTGVLSDLVAHGVTGLLVPRDRLPEALRSLLADPTLRESMGLAAVDRTKARFDTAVVGAHLERLLLETVAGEAHAAAS